MAGQWIGIDLGTYNSSAAFASREGFFSKKEVVKIVKSTKRRTVGRQDQLSLALSAEKEKEFPSFICFDKDGSVLGCGAEGKEMAWTDPEHTVWGIKRLLGKSYAELKESGELDRFRFRIKPDRKNGECLIAVEDKTYTPVKLCSILLEAIKAEAEHQVEGKIDSVVISVPAYYDPLRVTPIVEAARQAGFVHIKTIPEPVAAALSNDAEITTRPMKVLVFDLGAGTLDVTVGHLYRRAERKAEATFEVVKNTGDARLGGIDMDDRLLKVIQEKTGLSETLGPVISSLRRVAEMAKIRLSEEPSVDVTFALEGSEYQCTMDLYDLSSALEGDGLEKNLLEECRRQVMAAIQQARWTPGMIEILILIGGPTKLPCIHEVLKVVFHSNPTVLQQLTDFYSGKEKIDRMAAVSCGAAMSVSRQVQDRVPYGYGLEEIEFTEGARIYKANMLIPRDSPYPFKSELHALGYMRFDGKYELPLIQQNPKIENAAEENKYRFVGTCKLAVRDPESSHVVVQMGYNENKELEVQISNTSSGESATYVGIGQFLSISKKYPVILKEARESSGGKGSGDDNGKESVRKPKKQTAPTEAIEKFIDWSRASFIFLRRKLDNHPTKPMMIMQLMDELQGLLDGTDCKSQYIEIYNRFNSLLWNTHSCGILTQTELQELTTHLTQHEQNLFRLG